MIEKNYQRQGFFKLYFANFKTMFVGNLLFSVPLIVFGAIIYVLALLTHQTKNIWFLGLIIPLVYPFFSGVTQITKDIVRIPSRPVSAVKSFRKGMKNNFLYFLLYGVLLYIAFLISYYSLLFYYKMALTESMFYIPLFVAVLISLFLLFMSFSLPILTVTLKLKLRYYFKNAALMAIGELPMNFYVLITTCVLLSACFTISVLTPYFMTGLFVIGVSLFLILPTGISYCSVYRLYPKIEDVFNLIEQEKNKDFPLRPIAVVPTDDDGNPITVDNTANENGYVFVNGRMIKKSQINHDN